MRLEPDASSASDPPLALLPPDPATLARLQRIVRLTAAAAGCPAAALLLRAGAEVRLVAGIGLPDEPPGGDWAGAIAEVVGAADSGALPVLTEIDVDGLADRGLLSSAATPLVRESGEVVGILCLLGSAEAAGRAADGSALQDCAQLAVEEIARARTGASPARHRFFATLSHELRTPISAIMLHHELLLSGTYGELSEAQQEGLVRSQRASGHLLDLVNDLLDLARLEEGKLEVQEEAVALHELARSLIAHLAPLAADYGCPLRLDESGAPAVLYTDPRRLRQILMNLLTNALKFGRSRPVLLRCLPGDGAATHAILEVRDEGPGIPPEEIPRIFEEYVPLGGAVQGTGLGLPICVRLARLLGGRLEVVSTPGEGSTFRLLMPEEIPEG